MKDMKSTVIKDWGSKTKLFYDPLQNNGKVTKLLNKSFSTGVNKVEDKIIFILYNTTTKQYEKYDLLNLEVVRGIIVRFLKTGIIMGSDKPAKVILDRILNNLKSYYRVITLEDILFIIKNFNLEYLYIYDESCSVYNIKPEMIQHYTIDLPEEERLTQPQLEEEITKEIHRDFRKENAGI